MDTRHLKHFRIPFIFLFWLIPNFIHAHSSPYLPAITAATQADLIVTGHFIPSGKNIIPIEVKEVLYQSTSGTIPSSLSIINSMYFYTVQGFEKDTLPVAEKELRIFYLKQYDTLYTIVGGRQRVNDLKEDQVVFQVCDTTFYFSFGEYASFVRDLKRCFVQDSNASYEYLEVIPENEYNWVSTAKPSISYIYQCNKNFRHIQLHEFGHKNPPIPTDTTVVDTNIYPECHERPQYSRGTSAYYAYPKSVISDTMCIPDSLHTGPILVQFVIETNGDITHIELFRNESHKYDAFIRERIQNMGSFSAGKINGRPARCYMRTQFYFKRKSDVEKGN